MEYHIWSHLIQILSFRYDLIDTIKPFFGQLTNNSNQEKYNINEEKYIPFLISFYEYQLKLLYEYEIIDEKIYAIIVPKEESSSTKSSNNDEKRVEEIIQGDKLEELQQLIRENDIESISPLIKSFNEVKTMEIPIITECIIEKATKCFKYLLINGIEDPTIIMKEQVKDSNMTPEQYGWDCMSIAIYYGESEIIKILEEKGIEKWNKSVYIEASILSYRNTITKEIINQINEKNETMKNEILKIGLMASAKNNNIRGAELLIDNGVNINAKDSFDQIMKVLIRHHFILL